MPFLLVEEVFDQMMILRLFTSHHGLLMMSFVLLFSFWKKEVFADAGHLPIGGPAAHDAVARSVVVKLYDHYFESKTITVKPRETVRFVIENLGQSVHEFMIGTPKMHAMHQQELIAMVRQGLISAHHIDHDKLTDHLHSERPLHSRRHYDLSSVLLEPGEIKTLVWNFPDPSQIQFACNIPGHFEAGMLGKFFFDN